MFQDWQGMLPIGGDVVIVEDNDLLRALMVDILSGLPANVRAFATADDALVHVLDSHGRCALLLADHGVPGQINGTELAELFREKWPDTPVVVVSGYELAPSALPEGVLYLQKPWQVSELIEAIARLLSPGSP